MDLFPGLGIFCSMIVGVEASRSCCQPPSVRLEIDFDLQFGRPFPEYYQKNEHQQKVHKQHLLSTPRVCRPRAERGVLHLESCFDTQSAPANCDSASPE